MPGQHHRIHIMLPYDMKETSSPTAGPVTGIPTFMLAVQVLIWPQLEPGASAVIWLVVGLMMVGTQLHRGSLNRFHPMMVGSSYSQICHRIHQSAALLGSRQIQLPSKVAVYHVMLQSSRTPYVGVCYRNALGGSRHCLSSRSRKE